jgi:hypothetical protein
MGEALPSMIWRANSELGPATKYLKRRVIDYFQQNMHVTTSGYYAAPDGPIDYAAFIGLLHAIGIDRILFSVDYLQRQPGLQVLPRIWGSVSLGYASVNKKLVIVPEEAGSSG